MEAEGTSNLSVSLERLSLEDFETASIRSAAPSYTSEAPSYHSTVPNNDPIPSYSPRTRSPTEPNQPDPNAGPGAAASPTRTTLLPSPGPNDAPTVGLPPIPAAPVRRPQDALPVLGDFRIPTWSNVSSNPAARHYHSVALRRARAAAVCPPAGSLGYIRRAVLLDRISEDEGERRLRFRPLEDPYLVGEVAARRARSERIARESVGMESVLVREDRRWDWFLGQSSNREVGPRGKIAGRIGALR